MSAAVAPVREVAHKLALLRAALDQQDAGAIRLRGVDWFAWLTAGGSNAVLLALETGVAELLVTRAEACVLTDEIEAARLRAEEVPPGFSFHVAPWEQRAQGGALGDALGDDYVREAAANRPVLSDRPREGEAPLPPALRLHRLVLSAPEQERYRALGLAAAQAMTEAISQARPDWSELDLAAEGARALWRRGIEPALLLAAGERRLPLFRHPLPTSEAIGSRAMLVFCARRHGLYANLTRYVCFGPAPRQEQADLMAVEATGLAALKPGNSLSAAYHALAQAYRHVGREGAIREHHQGGITGYRAREIMATDASATELETGMAFAFNPGFEGIKIEDTFLLGQSGLENLTCDPAWPATEVQGRMRPLWLEAR
ncbi:M24 family metallopeptidase [Massilia horti]|uniref:M24 family metallopeptidase n=1 Tax=Massilia horti TaxID=2562153 RepID=A0A4Y9T3H6_9BURK|nr:M24 family metallopeptidase [Massilia horti]TFW34674.1 M24 family metallopeptidase [Massilia horti]